MGVSPLIAHGGAKSSHAVEGSRARAQHGAADPLTVFVAAMSGFVEKTNRPAHQSHAGPASSREDRAPPPIRGVSARYGAAGAPREQVTVTMVMRNRVGAHRPHAADRSHARIY